MRTRSLPLWPKSGQCAATGSSRSQPPALDLLPEGDRRERLGAGEEGKERLRPYRLAALGISVPGGEVKDEPAAAIDRQGAAREEPQRADLLVE